MTTDIKLIYPQDTGSLTGGVRRTVKIGTSNTFNFAFIQDSLSIPRWYAQVEKVQPNINKINYIVSSQEQGSSEQTHKFDTNVDKLCDSDLNLFVNIVLRGTGNFIQIKSVEYTLFDGNTSVHEGTGHIFIDRKGTIITVEYPDIGAYL